MEEPTPKYEFIMVTPTNPSVMMGGQVQFTATGALFDGTTEDITATATWSSSNTAVASVGNTDPYKGLADTKIRIDGITTITASKDGTIGSTTLTVTRPTRGPSTFGFVAKDAGFVFEINATDFADNLIIWIDGSNQSTNFFTEWVDGSGVWHALSGSVDAGDIVDEAANRGLMPGDFMGFEIFGMDGNDTTIADGTGTVGTLPGATIGPTAITEILTNVPLYVDGGKGEDEINGGAEDDILIGGLEDYDDTLVGGGGDDSLDGGAGADLCRGGEGNDILFGGTGDFPDTLIGGGGDDFLDGGAGADSCSGGKGMDWIVMEYVGVPMVGLGELVDLTLVGVFGNEGQDTFEIIGTAGPMDEFEAMSELALAGSLGFSDFDSNEDQIVFP